MADQTRHGQRSDKICRNFQKGLCHWGNKCHKTHIYLPPEACITEMQPRPEKPQPPRKVPATVLCTAPDGTVFERETCKLGAVGLCTRGDRCQNAHIIEPSADESGTMDNPEGRTNVVSNRPSPQEASGNASEEVCAGASSQKSDQVCRLYFRRRPCYKMPCKFSHDILDLAKLPADDELVLQHAGEIRTALEHHGQVSAAGDVPPHLSSLQAIADTVKKRPRKPPKKPSALMKSAARETVLNNSVQRKASDMQQGAGASHGEPISQGKPIELGGRHNSRELRQEHAAVEESDDSTADATYHSAQETNHSTTVRGHVAQPTLKPCFDFIHGRCQRPYCRFSHNVDVQRMREEFQQRKDKSSSVEAQKPVESGAHPLRHSCRDCDIASTASTQPTFHSDRSQRASSSGMGQDPPTGRASRVVSRKHEPAVPPGLGYNTRGGPCATESKPPPEIMNITVLDSTKVTFGPGFLITHIATGFECPQIILENVPSTAVPAFITSRLEVFGKVTAVVPSDSSPGDSTIAYKVTFSSGHAAAEAAEALNGSDILGAAISARVVEQRSTSLGRGTLYDGDVLFKLPTPTQIGYIGYPTEELAQKAMALARSSSVGFSRITAELYQGIPTVGTYNVRFHGLPPTFTTDDLKKHFVDRLKTSSHEDKRDGKRHTRRRGKGTEHRADREREEAAGPTDEEKCEGVMLQRAKYQSLNGAIHGLCRMLEDYDEDVSLNVLSPPYGKFVPVWAHFTDPQAAAKACEALHRFCPRFTNKERIFAHHIKSLRYALPPYIFDVLAHDIDLLRSYIQDDEGTSISVIDRRSPAAPTAPVTLKLVSHSMPSLTKAKKAFDRLLRGEKVTDDGHIVWSDFFGGQAGASFLRELEQKYPKVKISSDPLRRTLALFGAQEERDRVREEIIIKARYLKSRLTHKYTIPGHLIGSFMREGLVTLQEELGRENVWVDLTNQKLVVRGEEDAQKVAQLAVLHSRQHAPHRAWRGEAGCPVCFSELSHPVTLSCGHTWCKDCLTGYLNASVSNKSFPLTCLANEARCSQPISLFIAQRLLSTEQFDAVVNAAFTAYIQERPTEFHYCPTPDCPQVYRKPSPKTKSALQCPSCLVRICPHCDMEYHDTVSCQDHNSEDELLFEEWKMGHDVKDCPNCKVPIERSAGCNHMTCISCKVHICWACLATFSRSGEVYDHMRAIHGGIGL
ncbi:hypothetical protein BD414DRAFT_416009 [Trametes punicea]|nr:hypothetical protein BD414DRAFT_416009 [Trametes punicea]